MSEGDPTDNRNEEVCDSSPKAGHIDLPLIKYIKGVGEIPLVSTEDLPVRQIVDHVSRASRIISMTHNDDYLAEPFVTEVEEKRRVNPDGNLSVRKSVKIPKGCEHIASFLGNKGLRYLEIVPDKILSIHEVHKELLALPQERISFYSIVNILIKRWFYSYPIYFQDRQVATLVQFLLDENKRNRVLSLLESFERGASSPHF